VPPWVKNELWRRARAVPSLDLRFADNKSLVDAVTGASLVTFTRASSGTVTNSARVLETVGIDVPRFDHDPTTGESLGLLVEEQRTNSIRNNTGVGAVAGTPGTLPTNWTGSTTSQGVSREIIGTGTENGINYIDIKISGTTTGTLFFAVARLEGFTVVAAANGQTWTHSAYVKLVGGTLANATILFGMAGNDSGGVPVAFPSNSTLTPTNASLISQRVVNTGTFANASVAFVQPYIQINATTGVAIDITLRIGLPQLEQGATVSSVIPTTTAAVTRSADVASITGSAFSSWYRQDEGTMFADIVGFPIASGAFPRIVELSDGTSNNFIRLQQYSSNLVRTSINTGNVGQMGQDGGTIAQGVRGKVALAVATDNCAFVVNAGTPSTDSSVTVPVVITQANILGGLSGSNAANSTIRRLTFWPQRLASSTLQNITQ
jgi:hypothetical protein